VDESSWCTCPTSFHVDRRERPRVLEDAPLIGGNGEDCKESVDIPPKDFSPRNLEERIRSSQNDDLAAMEEGRSTSGEDNRGDAVDDEDEETPNSRKPMVFKRFYNNLREECSMAPFSDKSTDRPAGRAVERGTDDGPKGSNFAKLNYANLLYAREVGAPSAYLRPRLVPHGPTRKHPATESSPSTFGNMSNVLNYPPLSSDETTRADVLEDGNRTDGAELRHPKKSYSSYLRHCKILDPTTSAPSPPTRLLATSSPLSPL
jgi:hypothetical protein